MTRRKVTVRARAVQRYLKARLISTNTVELRASSDDNRQSVAGKLFITSRRRSPRPFYGHHQFHQPSRKNNAERASNDTQDARKSRLMKCASDGGARLIELGFSRRDSKTATLVAAVCWTYRL